MDGNPIMAGRCTVVSLTITLPSDCYLRIEQLAKVLGVSVNHAAALTIYAGQAAQDTLDAWKERLDNL
jgi:hypothetical protein